jgi:uncharacterized protein YecT (DUF1311 family)
MRAQISTLSFLLALTAEPLHGQVATGATNCPTDSTTLGMHLCLDREFRHADSALNRYYAEAVRVAVAPTKLRGAEVNWVHFRNINCAAQAAEYEGGTMEPLVELSCWLEMTQSRTHELWSAYLRTADSALPEPSP